jgi:GPH family glycoside/pentoside/hexuronide:cation symporter
MTALAPGRLPRARKAGFALGDYACNLCWNTVTVFLMFYYTDVLGLPAATAGFVFMIASIYDGITDPIMGAIADRTRTRWGQYRPYLLFGAAPMALSFVFLFYKPALDLAGTTAVALAAHLAFRTCYTVVSIPYTSLTAKLTDSSSERSSLAGYRMVFATMAGLTISWFMQPMVATFGGGDQARGFFYAACVIALLVVALLPVTFAATREPAPQVGAPRPAISATDIWRFVANNRAFWAMMACVLCAAFCSTVFNKSVLYYFKYYLGDEASSRYALSLSAAAGLVIIPSWVAVTGRIGKRMAWFVASGLGLVVLAGFWLLPVTSVAAFATVMLAFKVSYLGLWLTFWSMLPDTVEYGEWRSGVRAESFTFGLGQFFLKAALGFGAGLYGVLLDGTGYVANVEQTPETLANLKTLMAAMPAAMLVAGAIAMAFHPIGRGVHERIVAELAARRTAAS